MFSLRVSALKLERIIMRIIFLLLAVSGISLGAKDMKEDQGLKITFDQASYSKTKNIEVQGMLSTFVNCGSQYATWRQFPRAINCILKNLDTDDIYSSVDMMLSISESGNDIYDRYGKEPCNTVVSKNFSIVLDDIFFQETSKTKILNFELQAEYAGHKSNILIFKKIPLQIRSY